MPLDIAIAGAGLAGLTAAIALVGKGHRVGVYERRDDSDDGISAAGIQIQPNALRVLDRLDLMRVVRRVGIEGRYADLRDYRTGETVGLVDVVRRGGNQYAIRRQLKAALVEEAVARGVVVFKGRGVDGVVEEEGRPGFRFSDGSTVLADLVIGADGTWSRVRKSLFPSFQPTVLSTVCHQIQVDEAFMKTNAEIASLERNSHGLLICSSPGRASFGHPGPQAKLYDLALFDTEYPLEKDPRPEIRLGWIDDVEPLRKRWSDHFTGLQQVLAEVQRYYKWRLVEVKGLPSWSNNGGNAVLIGDACHSMTPYAGQGSAMGIEDAAVLAELLDGVEPGDNLMDRLQLFEKIRRKRCESAQKYAATLGRLWSSTDEKMIAKVNQAALYANSPAYLRIKPDPNASFHSPAFEKWLDLYDASAEVRKALDDSKAQARL